MHNVRFLERLKPKSSGILQERHQRAVNVKRHNTLEPSNELPSDEDSRDRLLLLTMTHQLIQNDQNLFRSLLFVKLVDGGTHAEPQEEALHHVAHAAAA